MGQDLLDKWEVEEELEKALKIIEEVYKEAGGPWGDPVINEDLYNRMKSWCNYHSFSHNDFSIEETKDQMRIHNEYINSVSYTHLTLPTILLV